MKISRRNHTHTHTRRHTEISTEQHTMEKCQTDLIWYFRYIWFFSSLFRWCTKNRLSVFCSTIFDAPLCFVINCKIFLPLKKLIGWNSSKSFSTLLLLYPLLGVSVSVMEYFTLEAFRHRKNQFIKWTNPFPYVLSTISSIAKFWNSWPILMIILIFRKKFRIHCFEVSVCIANGSCHSSYTLTERYEQNPIIPWTSNHETYLLQFPVYEWLFLLFVWLEKRISLIFGKVEPFAPFPWTILVALCIILLTMNSVSIAFSFDFD